MDLIFTIPGIVSATTLVALLVFHSKHQLLGAASLPAVMCITSLTYFYVMPAASLVQNNGQPVGFFGLFITSIEWMHVCVLMYALGAHAAFLLLEPRFKLYSQREKSDVPFDLAALRLMFLLVAAVTLLQIFRGKLNIGLIDVHSSATDNLRFLNLFFTSLVSLSVVYAVRQRFSIGSVLIALVTLVIFVQIGFRFRVLLLIAGLVTALFLLRGSQIRLGAMLVACFIAIAVFNVFGSLRSYGSGLDFDRIFESNLGSLAIDFGGEIGPVYVFAYLASIEPPQLSMFEPWVVAVARLVPTFLWESKPTADYLSQLTLGFWSENAAAAGIAAPQHVEMLLQFGWLGIPFLAFLYFSLVALLVQRIQLLNFECRIAGSALVPAFFGYYMQTRGYFFQILSDGLFLFGPIFLLSIRTRINKADRSAIKRTPTFRYR